MISSVALIREERFFRTADGKLWSRFGAGQHTWLPFSQAFREIFLVARVQDVSDPPSGASLVCDGQLQICPIPYFQGPWQYLQRIHAVHRELERWLATTIPLVLRIPSPLANALCGALTNDGRRFAVEVAGDPYDQMAPGAMRHPLRPLFRRHYADRQKALCRSARVVKYVTRSTLQRRYPAAESAAVHTVSDVFLPSDAFHRREPAMTAGPLRLLFVGMLEQLYKGPDVLLEAMGHAIRRGTPCALRLVGDGRYRPWLEKLADRLGLRSSVEFVGACDRLRIQQLLDDSDLFVLPSRQEGLPRAMLEAMARSLSCVGTDVGGIPELLDEDFLVPPNDAVALARKLNELASNRPALLEAGRRNWTVAQQHRLSVRLDREGCFARDVRQLCC
jgi:phosphatidylinositol alpha-1,6-mannosyltransferase